MSVWGAKPIYAAPAAMGYSIALPRNSRPSWLCVSCGCYQKKRAAVAGATRAPWVYPTI